LIVGIIRTHPKTCREKKAKKEWGRGCQDAGKRIGARISN